MMRVLVTADTVGGVWTYTRELVTGLVRRGLHVILVSFGQIPEPRQLAWTEGLRNLDYRPTAFRLEWMQDSAEDIAASSEYLLSVISETCPDLLHLNQFCYGALPVEVPKIVVAHSDVVSWWVGVHGSQPPHSAWMAWYRDTVQRGLDGATTVLAPSRWMLSQIERYYGPREDSGVIYNGRSPQYFNPHGDKDDFVLTVGRLWDPAKQVALVTHHDCGWPVVIAGETQHPDQAYRSETRPVVCEGMLELKGRQSEPQLHSLFSAAAIYVATSRYEPFGLAPLEAALSRCAIVANDIPSLRELWGETACYFRTNDAASLRDTIVMLRKDRVMRRHYAELAYQRARRRFTADRMVDEYLELYRMLGARRMMAA
ncbi:MAG TPA: glycosyltransferase family 4 protein [Candidatus Binatia bacterium]|nr:glycosyltransferase family 4 protein [Candidatus Binatia bacterium]